ncbi:hypothetical protein EN862_009045 [Mesorhizobium sp. M2E.F.Ca.ET.219.01.1.1]|nr:hypothetical protein EN862_009045 [Mesorhizobium sp. M2E.F.Ca.ET.219.01.1.1]
MSCRRWNCRRSAAFLLYPIDAIPDGKPFHTFPGIALQQRRNDHARQIASPAKGRWRGAFG